MESLDLEFKVMGLRPKKATEKVILQDTELPWHHSFNQLRKDKEADIYVNGNISWGSIYN